MNEVEQYLHRFPDKVQQILKRVRSTIRDAAPDSEETIKYEPCHN